MAGMFKVALLVASISLWTNDALPAPAFEANRGLNLDQWVTWPTEDKWSDPSVLDPFPEWRRSVGAARLAELKSIGFDHVRIPVDPSVFLSPQTAAYRDTLYAGVLAAVRGINEAGLKAVVDLHLIPRHDNAAIGMDGVMDDPAMFEAYLDVVRTMGRALSRLDPARVAFELMNEPHGECEADSRDWPERLQRLYAAARSSALDLTLVLSGACGGSAEGLSAVDPGAIPDDNVIWTFHSYQPFLLTHQGALWAGDFIRYVTGIPYPPSSMDAAARARTLDQIHERIRTEAPLMRRAGMSAYLDEQFALIDTPEKLRASRERPFKLVAEWASANGIDPRRIYLGEFGMIRQEWDNPFVMPPQSRAAYVADMIQSAERFGFGWAMWSYGGAFGVVEEFEGRAAEPDVLDVVRNLEPRP